MITPSKTYDRPDFWRIFGHSWWNYQTGPSGDQTGRVDAMFAGALDVEKSNWKNYAVNGATACGSGRSSGGWARVLNQIVPPTTSAGVRRSAPYAPDGGATILGYGINDLGVYGGQTAAVRTSYVDATRAQISRARASSAFLVTDSAFVYGAGFSSNASGNDLGQGPTDRLATTTTSATITMTLPADYAGEVVSFGWIKRPDVTNGTITISGTAGGTFGGATTFGISNGGGIPAAFVNNSYTCCRVRNLSSANAGQTIILTLTSLDASGNVFFDGGWFEADTPPPVIICNIARVATDAQYIASYPGWSGTEAAKDGNVLTTNGLVETMVQEFDSMVQIADAYTAIAKNTTMTNDGVHPNEKGAAAIVDSFQAAIKRLRPGPKSWGDTMSMNPPQPRAGYSRLGRRVNFWYCSDDVTPTYSTYTPVAGDLFAVPFEITEPRDLFSQFSIEVAVVGTVAPTLRWGIYDDIDRAAYPQQLTPYSATQTTAFSSAITPAAPSIRNQNMLYPWPPDPGMYWLVLKVDTAGTGQTWRSYSGTSRFVSQRGSTGLASAIAGCALKLTGQGSAALAGTFPTGAAPTGSGGTTASVPVIQILKAK